MAAWHSISVEPVIGHDTATIDVEDRSPRAAGN